MSDSTRSSVNFPQSGYQSMTVTEFEKRLTCHGPLVISILELQRSFASHTGTYARMHILFVAVLIFNNLDIQL